MKQMIAKSRKEAIEFAEGGNGKTQRAAYWMQGKIINRAEVIPGQKIATITDNVGGYWWSATKTIADKFGIKPTSAAAAALGSIKSPRKAASSRENGKVGGRKSLLRRACENNYGFLDVTPGTDIAGRLGHVSESSITKYIKNGWVKKIGSGLVLTHDGYNVL